MIKINTSKIKYYCVIIVLFVTQIAKADPPVFNDGTDVEDVPVAPINDWIVPIIIIGLIGMYVFYRKQIKATSNE